MRTLPLCLALCGSRSRVWFEVPGLTNRWSQTLAVVKSTFDFMKQFQVFATLALASGGAAPSR